MLTWRKNTWAVLVVAVIGCKKPEPTPAAGASAAAVTSAAPAVSAAPAATGALQILDGFEGQIGLSAQGKLGGDKGASTPAKFTVLVKDGNFRVDVPESLIHESGLGSVFVLVQPAAKKLYAVMDSKKQAVFLDFDKLGTDLKAFGDMRPGPKAVSDDAAPEITKTKKSDKVAGYPCEIWEIADKAQKAELCIASEGASWFHLPFSGLPAKFAWAAELADGKHFPLRLVVFENGAESGRLEVTSIEKKALPASQFEVPPGYAVMDLERMMGGMLGAGAIPGMPPGLTLPPGVMPPGQSLPPGFNSPPAAKIESTKPAAKTESTKPAAKKSGKRR